MPVCVFKTLDAVYDVLGKICNAFEAADEPVTTLADLDQHAHPLVAGFRIFTWHVQDESTMFKVVVHSGDAPNIVYDDLKLVYHVVRRVWNVRPPMCVDRSVSEHRSEQLDMACVQTAADLLEYIGASQVAVVEDIQALEAAVRPPLRIAPPPPARRRAGGGGGIVIRGAGGIHQMIAQIVQLASGEDFFAPVPLGIPDAPKPKRTLPEEWSKRLREVEAPANDDDTCITCCTNRKTIKIFPCEHLGLCDECMETMMTSDTCQKTCPECRGDIESFKSLGKKKRVSK